MQPLLLAAVLLLLADPPQGGIEWNSTDSADVAIVRLDSAPFPHRSRESGYTNSKGEFFPADPHYIDNSVGIVIPRGYRPGPQIDFVVHFHGHRNNVANVLSQFDLPVQLARSGRNAILVIPQGARDAPDEAAGKIEDENGLARLLQDVAQLLKREGRTESAAIGKVVLTAHSGGYLSAACSIARGGLRDHICDVLLFDATYGGLDDFADFAAAKQHRLLSIFTSHLADRNFILLTKLRERNADVDVLLGPDLTEDRLQPRRAILIHTRDLGHNDVVSKRDYFSLFLKTSALDAR